VPPRIKHCRDTKWLFSAVSNAEVRAIWMMKDKRGNARFRVHHETFGELDADFLQMGCVLQGAVA
jgi:hypothetical protein